MYEEKLKFSRRVDVMVYKDTTMKWAHASRKALFLVGLFSSLVFVFQGARAAGIIPSDVVSFANEARMSVGLRALTPNSVLTQAAEYKAQDMIEHDYFAHTSPAGVEPWFWFQKAGYQYKAAGENLAINYTDAREQHTAWMQSETHRANILGEQYQEIGVAVVSGTIDGKESLITVEFFGTPFAHVADQVSMSATEGLVATLSPKVGQAKGVPKNSTVISDSLPSIVPETTATPISWYCSPKILARWVSLCIQAVCCSPASV